MKITIYAPDPKRPGKYINDYVVIDSEANIRPNGHDVRCVDLQVGFILISYDDAPAFINRYRRFQYEFNDRPYPAGDWRVVWDKSKSIIAKKLGVAVS